MILAPVIRDRKGEHQGVFDEIRAPGVRARARRRRQSAISTRRSTLAKNKKHTIEVVVDRLVVRTSQSRAEEHPDRVRIIDSLETALRHRERRRDRVRSSTAKTMRLLRALRLRRLRHQLRRDRSRATSPSTRRTAPVRTAPASASKLEFDPDWSCRTRI